jgi:RHS repeat-associated protein
VSNTKEITYRKQLNRKQYLNLFMVLFYDIAGNTLSTNDNGSTTNYSWDYENRMITATLPNSDVSTFTYDGMGLRRKSETPTSITKFILDGQDVLLETNDGGTTQVVYTQTPSIYGIVLSQRRLGSGVGGTFVSSFYHYDVQGSVTELTDSSKAVTDTYRYYAFGKTLVSTGSTVNPYGYNGKVGYYTDAGLGLQYLRNRWYNPTLGRFLSEDPAMHGKNWYSYVSDNPISFIDPSGLVDCEGGLERCKKAATDSRNACYTGVVIYCAILGPGFIACVITLGVACSAGFIISIALCEIGYGLCKLWYDIHCPKGPIGPGMGGPPNFGRPNPYDPFHPRAPREW